jgi:hypothetical protein
VSDGFGHAVCIAIKRYVDICCCARYPTCRGARRGSERGSGIVVPVMEIMVVRWGMINGWDYEVSWMLIRTLVDWRA